MPFWRKKPSVASQPIPTASQIPSPSETPTAPDSFRLGVPDDGGCRRGYCYACGIPIGCTPSQQPTLPRGDKFWFCTPFCHKRTLRGFLPDGYKYEQDKVEFYWVDDRDIDQAAKNHAEASKKAHAEAAEYNRKT